MTQRQPSAAQGAGAAGWASRPFWNALASAAGSGWSGRIEALGPEGPSGMVVFHKGRVAWAVCKGQREDLGRYLWRLGKLSPEALKAAQARYRAEGGQRKLGAILEQDHQLDRPVLRHCLRLHTRQAVDALAQLPECTLLSSGDLPRVRDDELTFPIEDFLPSESTVC